jgi:hypothetical protein
LVVRTKRAREAVPHLRYGVANGFNTSDCFVSLAAAEAEAGDLQAAEATLRYAVKVYPRSVFCAFAMLRRCSKRRDE